MKRFKVGSSRSKRSFRKSASMTHKKNIPGAMAVMRGGIRLQMPCFCPLKGYRSRTVTEEGKRSLVFHPQAGFIDMPVDIPCGRCIGCRLERSRQWAIRCVHEASLHAENCFVTLTYDDDNLPNDGGLVKSHLQLFWKRLRKQVGSLRYYACGEYGPTTRRPHYHACVFGYRPSDLILYTERDGVKLYLSPFLQRVWGLGFVTVGDVSFESAAYCARYITSKITGDMAEEHYKVVDPTTGELFNIIPEFALMSRRPGIGNDWISKYRNDVWPRDIVISRGRKVRPPRFYESFMNDDERLQVKQRRVRNASLRTDDNTFERLTVRQTVLKSALKSKRKVI